MRILIFNIYIYILVGVFDHPEKYESQWEGLSHILWENMFETTNQYIYIYVRNAMMIAIVFDD